MALHLSCSAKYLRTPARIFDKITEEYDPPSYWFRLKVVGSGVVHKQCDAQITSVWAANGRSIAGVDPIQMFWLGEPTNDIAKEKVRHFTPDLIPGKAETLGFMHVKLLSKYRNPDIPLPANNTPADQVPEVKLDRAKQENTLASKKMTFPYGTYFIKVLVTDSSGAFVSQIFRVDTANDPKKCKIRTSRFYERAKISMKSVLSAIKVGTGLPAPQ